MNSVREVFWLASCVPHDLSWMTMALKTALVTGASRGIGRGIAIELARAGCRVVVNYAGNAEAAAEALALVRAAGGDGITVQGDIAVAADRERLVEETVAK